MLGGMFRIHAGDFPCLAWERKKWCPGVRITLNASELTAMRYYVDNIILLVVNNHANEFWSIVSIVRHEENAKNKTKQNKTKTRQIKNRQTNKQEKTNKRKKEKHPFYCKLSSCVVSSFLCIAIYRDRIYTWTEFVCSSFTTLQQPLLLFTCGLTDMTDYHQESLEF